MSANFWNTQLGSTRGIGRGIGASEIYDASSPGPFASNSPAAMMDAKINASLAKASAAAQGADDPTVGSVYTGAIPAPIPGTEPVGKLDSFLQKYGLYLLAGGVLLGGFYLLRRR